MGDHYGEDYLPLCKVERQLLYLFPDEDPEILFLELFDVNTHQEIADLLAVSTSTIFLYAERRGIRRERGSPPKHLELEKRLGSNPKQTLLQMKERLGTWKRVGKSLHLSGRELRNYREWKGLMGKSNSKARKGDWKQGWEYDRRDSPKE